MLIFFFTEYEDVSQEIEEKKITSSKIPEIESKSNSNTFEFEILYLFVKNMNSRLTDYFGPFVFTFHFEDHKVKVVG